ncbi:MAG: helix-turn-helix domain-containing protein [Desulfomonilaceae bacterium]
MDAQSLSRRELATRWGISVKTVDRLRETGQLPWIDLSTSPRKPLVRFPLAEIERFERERRGHRPADMK